MNLKSYLQDLADRGFLKAELIGLDQIKALIINAEKNFSAAKKNLNIDEETSYTMAYLAMLKVARALIFLQGFRPDDGQQHKTTIDVAGKILGPDFNNLINRFDRMRRKRNEFTYDPLLPLSKTETENALKTAEEFFKIVKNHFAESNSQKTLFKNLN